MGFNKRWINKENLLTRFSEGGLKSVKAYLSADALFVQDEFSRKILDQLNKGKEEEAIKLFEDETL